MKKRKVFVKLITYCFNINWMLSIFIIMASAVLGTFSTIRIWIIGEIVGFLSDTGGMSKCLVYYLILLVITLMLQKLIFSVIPYFRNKLLMQIKHKLKKELLVSVSGMSTEKLEMNETQQMIGRAMEFIETNFERSIISILVYLSSLVSVVSVVCLLGKNSWLFPVIAALTSLPIIAIRLKQDSEMHEMYKRQFSDNKEAEFYLNSLTERNSMLELVVFEAKDLFLKEYIAMNEKNMKQRTGFFIKYVIKGNFVETLLLSMGNLLSVLIALYIFLEIKSFTLSILVIVLNGIIVLQDDVIGFAFNTKYIYQAALYGDDFWNIISEDYGAKEIKIFDKVRTIELKGVGYQYPDSEEWSLRNINLRLEMGKTIGIVGHNGSGKSTLCKIILGIYQPTEGSIIINDEEVKCKYKFKNVGAVFQDYNRYETTIKDNIIFGKINNKDDYEMIESVSRKAGIDSFVAVQSQKYDTVVGNIFENGMQLSGGEWQRLAVARGMYSNSDILAFDEPNASMDAKAEKEMYKMYKDFMDEKTRIGYLISHRLGSTKMCNKIIVLENGEVIEEGDFKDLMGREGKYYSMYSTQADLYK